MKFTRISYLTYAFISMRLIVFSKVCSFDKILKFKAVKRGLLLLFFKQLL